MCGEVIAIIAVGITLAGLILRKFNVSKWHPAKIAVVWISALISYVFFYDVIGLSRNETRAAWFFVLAVAAVITWRWLSTRERGSGEP